MAWYNLNEKEETIKQYETRVKYDKIICKKANSINDIIDSELKEGTQYRFVTNNHFNAITVIKYITSKYEVEEMYIAIYRMNQKSVEKLKEYVTAGNIKMTILLSSFFRENKRYEKWCESLINFSKINENVNICFGLNHAKIFACKTKCEKHIVFEGSGNLSDNARVEQYLLEENKQMYNFHKNWITEFTQL